jgi:hypothetical protein
MRKTLFALVALTALAMTPTGASAQNALGGAIVGAGVGAGVGAAVGAQADGRYYYHDRYYSHRECWRNHNGRLRCRYY